MSDCSISIILKLKVLHNTIFTIILEHIKEVLRNNIADLWEATFPSFPYELNSSCFEEKRSKRNESNERAID